MQLGQRIRIQAGQNGPQEKEKMKKLISKELNGVRASPGLTVLCTGLRRMFALFDQFFNCENIFFLQNLGLYIQIRTAVLFIKAWIRIRINQSAWLIWIQ